MPEVKIFAISYPRSTNFIAILDPLPTIAYKQFEKSFKPVSYSETKTVIHHFMKLWIDQHNPAI